MLLLWTRRRFVIACGATWVLWPVRRCTAAERALDLVSSWKHLERQSGGRLGIAALDCATGITTSYRGDQRFSLCSVHKVILAAVVLARVEQGHERLDRTISFEPTALAPHSPMTTPHAGKDGMTVGELCAAAVGQSDNTAANLLFESVGGPQQVTSRLRRWGDRCTRLDRIEPELNSSTRGDVRDTTTPLAMLALLRGLFTGPILGRHCQEQLADWLVASSTGKNRLRAAFPARWRVGDKTGSGADNATHDVAIAWPPGELPKNFCDFLHRVETSVVSTREGFG